MRFVDFLKATVLTCAAAASALAAVTIAAASARGDPLVSLVAVGWWALAAVCGAYLGRRDGTSAPIGRLLAEARTSTALPEQGAARVLLNRLWPLLLVTVGSGAVAFVAPQVPATAGGFAIMAALGWRHQEAAVAAVEERDGARFYIEPTSPLRPIRLVRTPGLRALR